MKHIRWLLSFIVLFAIVLPACTGKTVSTSVTLTITPSETSSPIPTLPPTLTPMPDPNLPCGGIMPERAYLFLDCKDVNRIRTDLASNVGAQKEWAYLIMRVGDYRVPNTYDPAWGIDTIGWEGGPIIGLDLGLAYLVSGDLTYGRKIKDLLDLVYKNTPQVEHLTNPDAPTNDGNESPGGMFTHPKFGAVPMQGMLFAYLTIRDTQLLSDAARETYDSFFIRQARLVEEYAVVRGNEIPLDSELNRNVPARSNLVAATYALAFPADAEAQEIYTRVRPLVNHQLGAYWEVDGGWGENTTYYGFTVLEATLLFAETLYKNAGEDLYAQDFNGRNVHMLCEFFLKEATPSGKDVAPNDTNHHFIDPGVFNLCAFRTNDASLYFASEFFTWGVKNGYGVNVTEWMTYFFTNAWGGLQTGEVVEPAYTSVLLPDTGLAVLRQNWTHESQYMAVQFTASRSHQEYAYGTAYLFDHGPWIIANGYHSTPNYLGAPTDQHSTVSLDNRNQTNTGGTVVAFADLGTSAIESVTARSYPEMQHARTVLWMKPWSQWLVVDDLAVDNMNRHTLQLRWYVWGSKYKEDGYWQIYRAKMGNTSNRALSIRVLSELPVKYKDISRSYDWDQWESDATGFEAEVEYPGKPTRLVTMLVPRLSATANLPEVTRLDSGQGTMLQIRNGDAEWVWFLPAQAADPVSQDFYINGMAGNVMFQNGVVDSYCLMNGVTLSSQGQDFILSDQPLYVEAILSIGQIVVSADVESKVSLYWPKSISSVWQGSQNIDFVQAGDRVTFTLLPGKYTLSVSR